MRSRRRTIAFRILAFVAVLMVWIGGGELAVRLLSDVQPPLRINDAMVGSRYQPGFDRDVLVPEAGREVRLRFNTSGFRGPTSAELT